VIELSADEKDVRRFGGGKLRVKVDLFGFEMNCEAAIENRVSRFISNSMRTLLE
jgi:hypothetical protein